MAEEPKTTWDKVNYVKRGLALACGIAVMVTSVLTFLNLFNWIHFFNLIRTVWNFVFGAIIILIQLRWNSLVTKRFGLLAGWFGRGMFYLFVGTNVIPPPKDKDEGPPWWTYVVGCTVIGVGVLELMFGARCVKTTDKELAQEQPAANMFAKKGSEGGGNAIEPTFTVNVTESQARAAAGAAASAANAVGPAATQAAVNAAASGARQPLLAAHG